MKITNGKHYDCHKSSLYIKIYKIHYRSDDYIKVTFGLFSKIDNYHVETIKTKLYLDRISHWQEYDVKNL
ncbi:MAG: hypothetical protein R3321_08090 [Nitrososphaeraceae archaeon]|nr:hypothetical protein [Nitrososphaeraceae archaeon]